MPYFFSLVPCVRIIYLSFIYFRLVRHIYVAHRKGCVSAACDVFTTMLLPIQDWAFIVVADCCSFSWKTPFSSFECLLDSAFWNLYAVRKVQMVFGQLI